MVHNKTSKSSKLRIKSTNNTEIMTSTESTWWIKAWVPFKEECLPKLIVSAKWRTLSKPSTGKCRKLWSLVALIKIGLWFIIKLVDGGWTLFPLLLMKNSPAIRWSISNPLLLKFPILMELVMYVVLKTRSSWKICVVMNFAKLVGNNSCAKECKHIILIHFHHVLTKDAQSRHHRLS